MDADALSAFMIQKQESEKLLIAINSKLDDFLDVSPEDISWSHTGTMISVRYDLQGLALRLGIAPDLDM